ncbi:hypothetical protein CAP35_11475 [Chitinophagaceae bacterium IBVUCB1]|nr:hypothetical protein CAP35_11475 [Chitinophagaceae bacterium IBVUCB1]
MENNNIYILSQPIHSGKTTLLMNWLQRTPNTAGILTPDVDKWRMLYDVAARTYHPLQVRASHPVNDLVMIGKYRFSKTGFHLAQQLLLKGAESNAEWVIADEVGLLEIKQQTGLEPAISKIISLYNTRQVQHNKLLLVIRDYLLDDARLHYKIENATVLDKAFFE